MTCNWYNIERNKGLFEMKRFRTELGKSLNEVFVEMKNRKSTSEHFGAEQETRQDLMVKKNKEKPLLSAQDL